MSPFYPFRGEFAQREQCHLFLPFFLYQGFPKSLWSTMLHFQRHSNGLPQKFFLTLFFAEILLSLFT